LEGDVDFTNSGGDIDMDDTNMDNANMNVENALDASQHQNYTAMEEGLSRVEGNSSEMVGADELEDSNEQELVDRLNGHLYPALDVEKSDAAGADVDMDCVNDKERDIVSGSAFIQKCSKLAPTDFYHALSSRNKDGRNLGLIFEAIRGRNKLFNEEEIELVARSDSRSVSRSPGGKVTIEVSRANSYDGETYYLSVELVW